MLYKVRSGDSGQGLNKMAETTVLLQQVCALQQQVESLQGLQTVVEEQRAVIMELFLWQRPPLARDWGSSLEPSEGLAGVGFLGRV